VIQKMERFLVGWGVLALMGCGTVTSATSPSGTSSASFGPGIGQTAKDGEERDRRIHAGDLARCA
jgi:uncharacterized protein YceK